MRKKKLTEQQLRALEARSRGTNRMEIANSMWNWIRVLGLKDAWDMEAARKKSKGRNLFVSQTYQAYGPMYDISMYNAVHFSTGRLLRACNPWVEENPDGTCTVSMAGQHGREHRPRGRPLARDHYAGRQGESLHRGQGNYRYAGGWIRDI